MVLILPNRKRRRKMTEQVEDVRFKFLYGQPQLTVDKQFRLLLSLLRKNNAPEHPVRVRRIDMIASGKDANRGLCHLANQHKPRSERYFIITIRKNDPWSTQIDSIIHEWAHTLTWYQTIEGKDHPDTFARKYGVLYRAYIED